MNINRCAERDRTIMKRLPVSRVDIGKGLCSEFRHFGGVDGLSVGHVLTDVWHPFDNVSLVPQATVVQAVAVPISATVSPRLKP